MLTGVSAFILMFGTAGAQSSSGIHTDGTAFKDDQGRTLILRGVNLGGTSKIPAKTSSIREPSRSSGVPFHSAGGRTFSPAEKLGPDFRAAGRAMGSG